MEIHSSSSSMLVDVDSGVCDSSTDCGVSSVVALDYGPCDSTTNLLRSAWSLSTIPEDSYSEDEGTEDELNEEDNADDNIENENETENEEIYWEPVIIPPDLVDSIIEL
uniref:Uncharacterized protein LOC114333743 n=1 Tax=Diabrotica virgifera virgifera TaxID=50390 RepID=A0A6P7FSZ1_DIAVI